MGFEMARRLAKAGCDITVWNRTRAKAEPLAKDAPRSRTACRTRRLRHRVLHGLDLRRRQGSDRRTERLVVRKRQAKMVVECSSISLDGSAELRKILSRRASTAVAPVSATPR